MLQYLVCPLSLVQTPMYMSCLCKLNDTLAQCICICSVYTMYVQHFVNKQCPTFILDASKIAEPRGVSNHQLIFHDSKNMKYVIDKRHSIIYNNRMIKFK